MLESKSATFQSFSLNFNQKENKKKPQQFGLCTFKIICKLGFMIMYSK